MIRRTLSILIAMVAIVGSASAQTLSVQPIEVQTGEQTELVVNLTGGTSATALQFNLKLPEGMTANANSATLGVATDGHTLCVEPLANGDILFILYSMDLKAFKNGELLRIPVTAGNSATNAKGQLYTIRTASAEAVSHVCDNALFNVIVNEQKPDEMESVRKKGVVNQETYNIHGQRVIKLIKGVYIVNRKKVLVK